AAVLDHVDDAQALLVVAEAARGQAIEHALTGVAEWRMAQVMAEGDRLGQFLVQSQHLGDAARNLRHLERVRQSRAVVVAGGREKDLRLVLEASKRLRMNDPVAVALEDGPDRIEGLRSQPAAARRAPCGLRSQILRLERLELLANR